MSRFQRKFYVDENLIPTVADALSQVYRRDWFGTPAREGLQGGVKDLDLFEDLQARDYSAIITMDAHQLEDDSERTALASCGLHWIGFSMSGLVGPEALARQTAIVLAGLPFVIASWRQEPTAYRIPNLRSDQMRVEPL